MPSASPLSADSEEPYPGSAAPAAPTHVLNHHSASCTESCLCFPITVDTDFSEQAQTILQTTCGEAIEAVTLEISSRKHQTKLWVRLAASAYQHAIHALIIGLPAAEFGGVLRVQHPHLF